VPDAVWRAVAALVPGGLGDRVALHLAVMGSQLRGEARFPGAASTTVATSGSTLAVVDLPQEGHATGEDTGRCLLVASYDA
jgi:hypothetical protein